jgi:2-polyprenyl-6-hydroxyphenyl methylase/3-demethylubiquinone-9 3-methyltransferase
MEYVQTWTTYKNSRGMNHWYDIIDWVGGYPYEVCSPDELFEFYKKRGFKLSKMKCKGVGLGCHEMVLEKE